MSDKQKGLFNISPNCNPEYVSKVKLGKRIFYVSLLTLLPLSMIFIIGLWYGTDTTIIFRNDEKVLGYRVGKVLTEDEYPQVPIAVGINDTDGSVFYAHASNITLAVLGTIGFIIVNQEFMQVLMNNRTLLLSLCITVGLSYAMVIITSGDANSLTYGTELLPITPYLRNHTVSFIVGNFGTEANKDVKFKVVSGVCIIPYFAINIQLENVYSGSPETYNYEPTTFQLFGLWNHSFNIDYFEESIAKRGVWEIGIDTIDYEPIFAYGMATRDIAFLMSSTDIATSITFNGALKRSYNLADIFTPVSQYTSTKISY